ncbi:hypothetical protein B0T21DRAFT_285004, partial [Apiosordaria backusii]
IAVKDYPSGYPQYSALVSSHDPFFAFRSFCRLRVRLLLSKQDELTLLESELDILDREEAAPFFLGTCRSDGNASRVTLLGRIHSKLAEYGNSPRQLLSYSRASSRDVTSLRNWLDETGCLSEEESLYLDRDRDLASLACSRDFAMSHLEEWVEDRLIQFYSQFRAHRQQIKDPGFEISSNPHVYIYSGGMIRRIAMGLLLLLITSLILTPVVVCDLVDDMPARITIITASTLCYLTVLSRLTKSRTIELILAGAT